MQYLQGTGPIGTTLPPRIARFFAEVMLYWRGHLRAKEIQDFLGVSERTARSLIADWRAQGLLPRYRPRAERHLTPAEDFDPSPSVVDPNFAFSLLLLADRVPGNPFSMNALPGGGHDLSISSRSGPARELFAACLDREAVRLIYASKTGLQEFTFHGLAVIRSRGRYHLRGYRSNGRDAFGELLNDRYVDVVPARTTEAWRTSSEAFVGLDDDEDWHTFEKRSLVLSHELSEPERLCYEHEYGIANTGRLELNERRALMPYRLQELAERRCWRMNGTSVPIWDSRELPFGGELAG